MTIPLDFSGGVVFFHFKEEFVEEAAFELV
jgi:hypothetical protein